ATPVAIRFRPAARSPLSGLCCVASPSAISARRTPRPSAPALPCASPPPAASAPRTPSSSLSEGLTPHVPEETPAFGPLRPTPAAEHHPAMHIGIAERRSGRERTMIETQDLVVPVAGSNMEMGDAMDQARATIGDFFKAFENPQPG